MEVQVEVQVKLEEPEEQDDHDQQDNRLGPHYTEQDQTLAYHQEQYQQHLQLRYQQQQNKDKTKSQGQGQCKERPKYCCPRDGCDAVFTRPYRLMGHIRVHDGIVNTTYHYSLPLHIPIRFHTNVLSFIIFTTLLINISMAYFNISPNLKLSKNSSFYKSSPTVDIYNKVK